MKKIEFPWILVVVWVLAVVIRVMLAWLPLEVSIQHYVPDGAFYYFAIARNVVAGHGISADGVTPTNGFHPLWAVLLLLPYAVTKDATLSIHLALSIGALVDALNIWLAWRVARSVCRDEIGGLLAACLYALNPLAAVESVNGLETSVVTLCMGLAVWFYLVRFRRKAASWCDAAVLGLGIGAMTLARTDYALFTLVLAGWAIAEARQNWLHRLMLLSLAGVVAGILWVPWVLWNETTFGTVVQSSAVAAPFVVHRARVSGFVNLALIKAWWPIVWHSLFLLLRYGGLGWGALAAAAIVRRLLRRPPVSLRSLIPLSLPFIGVLLILTVHIVVRWYPRGWYFAPWAWASVVLVGPALVRMVRSCNVISTGRRIVWIGGIVLAFVVTGQAFRMWSEPSYPWQRQMLTSARWVSEQLSPETVVASFNSGLMIYFSDQPVVNLDGVVKWDALYALQDCRLDYIDQRRVRYLIDFDTHIFGLFQPYYGVDPAQRLRRLRVFGDVTDFGQWGIYAVMPPEDGTR